MDGKGLRQAGHLAQIESKETLHGLLTTKVNEQRTTPLDGDDLAFLKSRVEAMWKASQKYLNSIGKHRNRNEEHHKTMKKPCKSIGKALGKHWKRIGKASDIAKQWKALANTRKASQKHLKSIGKPLKKLWKFIEKASEQHRKSAGKRSEKHLEKCSGKV